MFQQIILWISSIPFWGYLIIILLGIGIKDISKKRHTLQRNFPVIGHLRYLLEEFGPPIRQYFVANNRDELPFNRRQRAWVYASSKKENNFQGFGTDQDFNLPGYVFIKHAMLPYQLEKDHPNFSNPSYIPSQKVIGLANGRTKPYRPNSVVNISGMSYGSLSANAIAALNKGALKFGCYHNTGEGGLSPHHQHGADIILNIGTAYFGIRNEDGSFSLEKLKALITNNPQIKAIELKLSQGAKPGKGGVLPASKITKEISEIRAIPMGQDVISPSYHTAFSGVDGMLAFIETLAEATGLPVGIKSAIGKLEMWEELADLMLKTGKGPDFITIDGGEGGTGAAPPAFADHVSLPFVTGFTRVYKIFLGKSLTEKTVFIASGKLGLPASALMAFSLGADLINIARETMLSIGCIQAQVCHTNRCPTGVATTNNWLQSGIDPTLKSERFYNYMKTLNKEILELTHACGYEHPSQMSMQDIEITGGNQNETRSLFEVFGYEKQKVPFQKIQNP